MKVSILFNMSFSIDFAPFLWRVQSSIFKKNCDFSKYVDYCSWITNKYAEYITIQYSWYTVMNTVMLNTWFLRGSC